jgi:uncharacterized protein (TIGR03437 family)
VFRACLLLTISCAILQGHAPPAYLPVPPLRVNANTLVDATGQVFVLRGAGVPGWETIAPPAYRIIQQRWNMNCVRLPLDITAWQREGAAYLNRVAKAVSLANTEGLVAILAAVGAESTGLPGADTLSFWRAASAAFRDTPGIILSLYHEPVRKNGASWPAWRDAMQPLVAAIRSAGAQQIIAAPSFQDAQAFQGFTREYYLQDANILYEVHPYFDTAATDAERTANFGNLAGTFPILAGAWGMPFGKSIPACTAIPRDLNKANELLYQAASYFDARAISWSIADFAAGSLFRGGSDYPATTLDALWACDATSDPATGLGQFVLLWLTGDPAGFGSLQASQIASAAGGFPGPIAPGEILSIYGQGIGPLKPVSAAYDATGRLPLTLSDTQVFFDGIAAPLFVTGAFQVNVQAPWEIAGRRTTQVQLIYRGVNSNTVELTVIPAAPELFTLLGTFQAAVLNQDGAVNDAGAAAPRGSVVSFFATGVGPTVPAGLTGTPASSAGSMINPVTLRMANIPVQVIYAGPAPGLVGVTQINARIPDATPIGAAPDRVSVILSAGGIDSRNGITFWVK